MELVTGAFERVSDGMLQAGAGAGAGTAGPEALQRIGAQYYGLLSDRTSLLLQLQGFAASGDAEVQQVVRERFARMWQVVADSTGLNAVTIKSFLAFGLQPPGNRIADSWCSCAKQLWRRYGLAHV